MSLGSASGPSRRAAASLAAVRHLPYWLDGPEVLDEPAMTGEAEADLAVVGAGYTGLWTALLAKERDPGLDVVVLEARSAGWAASGRNGGGVRQHLLEAAEHLLLLHVLPALQRCLQQRVA